MIFQQTQTNIKTHPIILIHVYINKSKTTQKLTNKQKQNLGIPIATPQRHPKWTSPETIRVLAQERSREKANDENKASTPLFFSHDSDICQAS